MQTWNKRGTLSGIPNEFTTQNTSSTRINFNDGNKKVKLNKCNQIENEMIIMGFVNVMP